MSRMKLGDVLPATLGVRRGARSIRGGGGRVSAFSCRQQGIHQAEATDKLAAGMQLGSARRYNNRPRASRDVSTETTVPVQRGSDLSAASWLVHAATVTPQVTDTC